MKHLMLDLETLSNEFNAVILSIGAVQFDPDGEIGQEFYSVINTASCIESGLSTNPETIDWWKKQSPEAQTVLREAYTSDKTLSMVLNEFSDWCSRVGVKYFWSNGASFDLPILKQAYINAGQKNIVPWKYYDEYCFRTVTRMNPGNKPKERKGAHNAVDDCRYQVEWIHNIFGDEI